MIRLSILLAVMILLTTTLAACGDGEQLQSDVQQALAKHTEMRTYRFSGSADLNIERPAAEWNSNPLTADLINILMNGQLTWEGIASVDPVRLELLLKLKPEGSAEPFEVPLLIHDNKMYIHIPSVNSADQYYEIDLQELSDTTGQENALSPQQLGSAGQLFSTMFHDIVSAVNPKRFNEEDISKDSGIRIISVTLNRKQVRELIDIWFDALPEIIDQLNLAGYLKPQTAESWKQKTDEQSRKYWLEQSDDIDFKHPLSLSMKIDEQGYLRETKMSMDITVTKDKLMKHWKADVMNRYEDINQNPPFTRPVPDNVKPFSDILKLLSGNQ